MQAAATKEGVVSGTQSPIESRRLPAPAAPAARPRGAAGGGGGGGGAGAATRAGPADVTGAARRAAPLRAAAAGAS